MNTLITESKDNVVISMEHHRNLVSILSYFYGYEKEKISDIEEITEIFLESERGDPFLSKDQKPRKYLIFQYEGHTYLCPKERFHPKNGKPFTLNVSLTIMEHYPSVDPTQVENLALYDESTLRFSYEWKSCICSIKSNKQLDLDRSRALLKEQEQYMREANLPTTKFQEIFGKVKKAVLKLVTPDHHDGDEWKK